MNKLNIKNALTKIGVTSKKQAEFFAAFKGRSVENIENSDISAVLEKLGVSGKQALNDFLAAVREPQIMEQELDLDELEAVAGGDSCDDDDADKDHCIQQEYRPLFSYGCAATVEYKKKDKCTSNYCEGNQTFINSTCGLNDGCSYNAVIYLSETGTRIT